ncbi:MAG: type I DNA topoisomerase [Deltaproteobacteria bacterium]
MAEYLVIVESPAKAKTIGKFLGKGYKIEASMGHIRDLPKSTLGVDIENDFAPKYIPIRGKGDLIKKLKKMAKNSDKVFLATDPDREGEAISWHLAHLLNLDESDKCRITFNEITKNAVKTAIKEPRKIDMDLVDAQQARRVLDRIVGYQMSPFLWKKVRKGLSAGRVQSVAVRMVVNREEEIENFVPEEYWSLTAKLSKKKGSQYFEAKLHGISEEKLEISSKEQMDIILADLDNASYTVSKIKRGEKKRYPAPPFVTSTLQQEAARKLGFPIKKTMMVAQQLYEGIEVKGSGLVGLITYMRTDSTRISDEAQNEAIELIKNKYGENYVPKERRIYKSKAGAQDAHEAIRPSHVSYQPEDIKDSLSNEQYKLYKLIWERFIASQMESAVYDALTVDIKASKYIFKAHGSKVKFAGFMKVYVEGRDDDKEENDVILPELNEGEELLLNKLDPKQHFTQPPARYTEATLVKAMEEKGIGRPSTYAPTITTILARMYIEKDKKYLLPTELGRTVTALLVDYFKEIVNIEFTAKMEEKLDDVEEGKIKWVNILREFYPPFEENLKRAEKEVEHIKLQDEVSDVPCEKCGRMMVIKMGRFGKFLACPGFPECRNAKPIIEEAGVSCPLCKSKVVVKKTKKGRKYFGCEKNPSCGFMTWDMPSNENCPECGNFLLKKKGGKTLGCSNPECKYEKGS